MRGAQAILMVYDVCNDTSFEHVKHWMDKIHELGGAQVQVILVGNKCDSENRIVTATRGENLAKTFEVEFMETSALDGHNIDRAFMNLAKKCVVDGKLKHRSSIQIDNSTKGTGNCCA